jgi:hypothetical protein
MSFFAIKDSEESGKGGDGQSELGGRWQGMSVGPFPFDL